MPDCIGDEKALKKTIEQNKVIVKQAYVKIKKAANSLKNGHATQEWICRSFGSNTLVLWQNKKLFR